MLDMSHKWVSKVILNIEGESLPLVLAPSHVSPLQHEWNESLLSAFCFGFIFCDARNQKYFKEAFETVSLNV